jgi:hypothetical protein
MVTIMVTAPLSGCIAVFKPDGADDSFGIGLTL